MELNQICGFSGSFTEIDVKEVVDQEKTTFTVFVRSLANGDVVMFGFDTEEEAMDLFRNMMKARIA